jgi:PAS domain S-box-containing protein
MLLLDPLLHQHALLLLFTLAVAASGVRGGFGPGLVATFVGAFGLVYLFPPKFSFTIAPEYLPDAERQLVAFIVVGVIISWLSGKLRQLWWEALGLAIQRNEILESITDGFGTIDANGRLLYLNRAAAQLMRMPLDHAIGKGLWEEVPVLRGSLVENMFRQVFDKHVAIHFEYLFPLSNRWFEIHAYPSQNSGLSAYFRDVSDRKLMELRLRQTLAERDAALERVRLLSGLLPICAGCKKIRGGEGNWHEIESYISEHSEAKFSHGMCPACGKQYYGELWPAKESKAGVP